MSLTSHSISSKTAAAMTTLYQQNRPDNCAICETFDAEQVKVLLSNPLCASLRIYYGMTPDKLVHAILVGADKNGNDIIPVTVRDGEDGDDTGILEEAVRCPSICPPSSLLNTAL